MPTSEHLSTFPFLALYRILWQAPSHGSLGVFPGESAKQIRARHMSILKSIPVFGIITGVMTGWAVLTPPAPSNVPNANLSSASLAVGLLLAQYWIQYANAYIIANFTGAGYLSKIFEMFG